jgi:hypothetical protein
MLLGLKGGNLKILLETFWNFARGRIEPSPKPSLIMLGLKRLPLSHPFL